MTVQLARQRDPVGQLERGIERESVSQIALVHGQVVIGQKRVANGQLHGTTLRRHRLWQAENQSREHAPKGSRPSHVALLPVRIK
jgi:hypothetical protein